MNNQTKFRLQVQLLHACNKTLPTRNKLQVKNEEKPNLLSSETYCLNQVKKYDRENYLAAICIKDLRLRRAVLAFRAFNVELSLVKDLTTSPERARLRFNFWSKLIEQIVARKNDEPTLQKLNAYYNYNPVAKELLKLFENTTVESETEEWLHGLIGTRLSSKGLGYEPFSTCDQLETYCKKSNSFIYNLSTGVAKQLFDLNLDSIATKCAECLGLAHGLSNIIRGIPYNSRKNCCYIPQDLLIRHGLKRRNFVHPNLDGKCIRPVVESLAARCHDLLEVVHYERNLSEPINELFLPRVGIQMYLNKLKKYDYDVCDIRVVKRNQLLPVHLWIASCLRWPLKKM